VAEIGKIDIVIVIGVECFWGLQDFDFCSNRNKFYQILLSLSKFTQNLPKFYSSCPNFIQICLNKFTREMGPHLLYPQLLPPLDIIELRRKAKSAQYLRYSVDIDFLTFVARSCATILCSFFCIDMTHKIEKLWNSSFFYFRSKEICSFYL